MKGLFDHIDSLDVTYFILDLEEKFKIKFIDEEISKAKTFGDLVDCIIEKLSLKSTFNKTSYTSQSLFYKMRKKILNNRLTDVTEITPNTKLKEIFPFKNRRKNMNKLQQKLGVKLLEIKVLKTPLWYDTLMIIFTLVLLLEFFFLDFLSWNTTLFLTFIYLLLLMLRDRFTFQFNDKTLGELVRRVMRENYIDIQTDNDLNINEIEPILRDLLVDVFDFKNIKINRNTLL